MKCPYYKLGIPSTPLPLGFYMIAGTGAHVAVLTHAVSQARAEVDWDDLDDPKPSF